MVDESMVGRSTPPFEMPVERGKIREFARATKSDNAAYLEGKQPLTPPTFLTTMNFWTGADASPVALLGLDLKRVLHGGQEYTFHGPPPAAGVELSATSSIESISEKEGKRGGLMTFVVAKTEFRDPQGTLVAEARATVIETGRPPKEDE